MKRALAVCLVVLLGLGGLAAGSLWSLEQPLRLDAPLVYDLARGSTVNGLAADLNAKELLASPVLLFRLYARLTSADGHLLAGEYQLEPGMTARTLLALLRSGKVLEREITFVEGWTFAQWRAHLAGFEKITQTLQGVDDATIMARLGHADEYPEGHFFPDTYRFVSNETDISLLGRAYTRMQETLMREWSQAQPSTVLESPYEALILASIVEKETGSEPDRDLIAGVFVNRLQKKMRLQSDPTVIYGVPDFDGDLTRHHLRTPTAHNTYTSAGLPPTPICNPGLASIRATLNPAPVPYYYFVARGDGTSEFSVTLAEHNRAVTRFQKGGRVE